MTRFDRKLKRRNTVREKVTQLGWALSEAGKTHAYEVLMECAESGLRWNEYWLSDSDEAKKARYAHDDEPSQKGVDHACFVLAAVVADVLDDPKENGDLLGWAIKAGFFEGDGWKRVLGQMGQQKLAEQLEAAWARGATLKVIDGGKGFEVVEEGLPVAASTEAPEAQGLTVVDDGGERTALPRIAWRGRGDDDGGNAA